MPCNEDRGTVHVCARREVEFSPQRGRSGLGAATPRGALARTAGPATSPGTPLLAPATRPRRWPSRPGHLVRPPRPHLSASTSPPAKLCALDPGRISENTVMGNPLRSRLQNLRLGGPRARNSPPGLGAAPRDWGGHAPDRVCQRVGTPPDPTRTTAQRMAHNTVLAIVAGSGAHSFCRGDAQGPRKCHEEVRRTRNPPAAGRPRDALSGSRHRSRRRTARAPRGRGSGVWRGGVRCGFSRCPRPCRASPRSRSSSPPTRSARAPRARVR